MDLDVETLRFLARLIEARLAAVEIFDVEGCPSCRDVEVRALLSLIRGLVADAEREALRASNETVFFSFGPDRAASH